MKDLLETEVVASINAQRNGSLAVWNKIPTVRYEDISKELFDIVDGKGFTGTIERAKDKGTATYLNFHHLPLRFICYEEYLNQFGDYTKGLGRADFVVHDLSEKKEYFIVHELSEGVASNKRSKARNQLFGTLNLLFKSPKVKQYIDGFQHRQCVMSASGGEVPTPNGMADGFFAIDSILPDPIPMNAKQITNLGFEAWETRIVKL